MNRIYFWLLTATIILGGGFLITRWYSSFSPHSHPLNAKHIHHQFVIAQAHTLLGFDLVDPIQAPSNIRESVLNGYRLIMNTPFYAPNYSGANISCTNCHFAEGDTLGGKNNGISLVGVSSVYPRYSERAGRTISLADRVNRCLEFSQNSTPFPENSQEMQSIIQYLNWISKETMSLKTVPWLGLTPLTSEHQPNPDAGRKVYEVSCSLCHKKEGEGGAGQGIQAIPPLWGDLSFNDQAGMSRLSTLASFVYWNMPYMDASLSEEEALDVAAFILQQPRPHKEGASWEDK